MARAHRHRTPSGATPAASAAGTQRVVAIDVVRGIAIIAMVIYHFCFDLAYLRLAPFDFYRDPWWLHARTLILSSFLLIVGVSLVLAERSVDGRARFWSHVVRIGACAALVSLASYVIFPRSYIWFGVLHAIAVSLVLVRPLAKHPRAALLVGVGVIAAGMTLHHPWFDGRALGWLGFMTAKPVTEDYVPLFPWMGVMLLGTSAGHWLVRTRFRALALFEDGPRLLARIGRHSLAIYMIHQPLFLGALLLVARA